jgi:hypothetical protein
MLTISHLKGLQVYLGVFPYLWIDQVIEKGGKEAV